MSSYRGGAWDGGPPGAEADYPGAPSYAPAAPPRAMPTTDPWTGVSYSQYGAPPYDYQTYAPGYTYAYDSSYYQRPDGTYYGKYPESGSYPQQLTAEYLTQKRERTRSPVDSHRYERRRSYRTNSRSVSPYDRRDSAYSKKRDSAYEESRRRRSRSKSSKRKKYSSSDRSSSRSHSYSPQKREKRRKSVSSNSSASNRSYRKKSSKTRGRDQSVPPRDRSISSSHDELNVHRMSSADRLSKSSHEAEKKSKDAKSHSKKDKKARKITTPTRKQKKSKASHKKVKKSPLTLPPKVHKKHKDRSDTLVKKERDSSLTPPKMYRMRMLSSSKSRSRSASPSPSPSPRHSKRKRSLSRSPHASRSRSSSRSVLSTPTRRSRSKSKRKMKRKSRSKSRTKRRSSSKTRSTSQRRSKSRGKGKRSVSKSGSKSRSRSNSSRSRSRTGSPTDEKRRGQFTVADRKRFWKMHRNRQEEKDKEKETKTPPKELKPPPGAVESTTVDDIEYGDPPEVEGPNFAELLIPDQAMQASTSKSRPGPLPIKNDGSFLEMFKKMQKVTKNVEPEKKTEIKKPALPFIGKRRGGRVLKTGLVKKAKAIDEQTANNAPKDAWSLYMQEVKKYRETSCEEERKTRPLVK